MAPGACCPGSCRLPPGHLGTGGALRLAVNPHPAGTIRRPESRLDTGAVRRVMDPHPGQRRQGACRFRHRRRARSRPRSVDRIFPKNGNRSRHQPADDSQHSAAGVDSAGHPVVRYRRGSQAVPDLLPHILTSCFNACQSAALQKPGCPISAQV